MINRGRIAEELKQHTVARLGSRVLIAQAIVEVIDIIQRREGPVVGVKSTSEHQLTLQESENK